MHDSVVEISAFQKGYPLRHAFMQSICISKAKPILFSENQKLPMALAKTPGRTTFYSFFQFEIE